MLFIYIWRRTRPIGRLYDQTFFLRGCAGVNNSTHKHYFKSFLRHSPANACTNRHTTAKGILLPVVRSALLGFCTAVHQQVSTFHFLCCRALPTKGNSYRTIEIKKNAFLSNSNHRPTVYSTTSLHTIIARPCLCWQELPRGGTAYGAGSTPTVHNKVSRSLLLCLLYIDEASYTRKRNQ